MVYVLCFKNYASIDSSFISNSQHPMSNTQQPKANNQQPTTNTQHPKLYPREFTALLSYLSDARCKSSDFCAILSCFRQHPITNNQ